MKFELFKSEKNDQYYFNLKARNGQVILSSEGYTSKAGAKNGIESVRKNAGRKEGIDRKVAKNGQHHFSVVSTNGQIVGKSELYTSKAGMENGIKSVIENSKGATVEERDS